MSISSLQHVLMGDLIKAQREFFNSGRTRSLDFRVKQLRTLRSAIIDNEAVILEACRSDMNKPPMEAYTSERGMVLNEIDHVAKNLQSWAKPRRAKTEHSPVWYSAAFLGLQLHLFGTLWRRLDYGASNI